MARRGITPATQLFPNKLSKFRAQVVGSPLVVHSRHNSLFVLCKTFPKSIFLGRIRITPFRLCGAFYIGLHIAANVDMRFVLQPMLQVSVAQLLEILLMNIDDWKSA